MIIEKLYKPLFNNATLVRTKLMEAIYAQYGNYNIRLEDGSTLFTTPCISNLTNILCNVPNIRENLKMGGGIVIEGDPAQVLTVKAHLRCGSIFAIFQYDSTFGGNYEI